MAASVNLQYFESLSLHFVEVSFDLREIFYEVFITSVEHYTALINFSGMVASARASAIIQSTAFLKCFIQI